MQAAEPGEPGLLVWGQGVHGMDPDVSLEAEDKEHHVGNGVSSQRNQRGDPPPPQQGWGQ